jgi:hypothetical protein
MGKKNCVQNREIVSRCAHTIFWAHFCMENVRTLKNAGFLQDLQALSQKCAGGSNGEK